MAADLGISRIYPSGKMIIMKTNMNRKVFRLMEETMASETHRNSLSFTGKEIKVNINSLHIDPLWKVTMCKGQWYVIRTSMRETPLEGITEKCWSARFIHNGLESTMLLHNGLKSTMLNSFMSRNPLNNAPSVPKYKVLFFSKSQTLLCLTKLLICFP